MLGRRHWLGRMAALVGAAAASRLGAQDFPGTAHQPQMADPDYRMSFPRDFGAHPEFRTEWWYVTGWLDAQPGGPGTQGRGFQVTFFRVRTGHPGENPSRFAPTQLLFAHAALMLTRNGHALHGQRAARIGSPATSFSERDADVRMGEWSLSRNADDSYRTTIRDAAFTLDLTLTPPGSPGEKVNEPWLQGDDGFSRKGPRPEQASHYYSRPQLRVSGRVDDRPATGVAWFDHEWSSTLLDPGAAGWDWAGLNMDDGSALVAFRIRRRASDADADEVEPDRQAVEPDPQAQTLWRYCAVRLADGRTERVDPIGFEVLRLWQSPRTAATYPVAMKLVLPGRSLLLEPLFEDQELDGRGSTGTVYWEGAVRVLDQTGVRVGLGYLELTGYYTPLRL